MRYALLAVLLLPSLGQAEVPTPFGVTLGKPLPKNFQKAQKCVSGGEQDKVLVWICERAPKMLTGAEGYLFGTYKGRVMKAVTLWVFQNDRHGDSALTKWRGIYDALTAKWGKAAKDFDFLKAGSIWKDHQDYAMSLHQNERRRASYWARLGISKTGAAHQNGVAIALTITGSSSTTTKLTLAYEDEGLSEQREMETEENEAGAL